MSKTSAHASKTEEGTAHRTGTELKEGCSVLTQEALRVRMSPSDISLKTNNN